MRTIKKKLYGGIQPYWAVLIQISNFNLLKFTNSYKSDHFVNVKTIQILIPLQFEQFPKSIHFLNANFYEIQQFSI